MTAKKKPAPKRRKAPAKPHPKGKAVLIAAPVRASRGSTEQEAERSEIHYLTGPLGLELARSNQRAEALLRGVGINVKRRPDTNPPQYDTTTSPELRRKLATIGEAISGVSRPVPRLPTDEEVAAITPPKPKMSEETKANLRERAKADPRPHDNGDPIARMLREADTLDKVYAVAAKYLGVKEKELREKYGHLNPGQQRMNCGNRMRGKYRKDNLTK